MYIKIVLKLFLYFTNYQLCYAHLFPGRLLCFKTFFQDDRSRNSDEISEKRGWDLYTSEFKVLTDFVEIDIYKINSKYTNTVTNEKKKKGKTSSCRLILWKMQIGLLKNQTLFTLRKATIASEGEDRRFLQRLA